MSQNVYQKPELTKYGNIEEITQARGGMGVDTVITGVSVLGVPVTTNTSITSPGSGTSINITEIGPDLF